MHVWTFAVRVGLGHVKYGHALTFWASERQESSTVAGSYYPALWQKQLCLFKINLNSN